MTDVWRDITLEVEEIFQWRFSTEVFDSLKIASTRPTESLYFIEQFTYMCQQKKSKIGRVILKYYLTIRFIFLLSLPEALPIPPELGALKAGSLSTVRLKGETPIAAAVRG
jgi:hypothetical protein